MHEERRGGRLLSYFVPEGALNRHVVLCDKDRLMKRRHGTILRTGQSLLPDENALSATCWMHGVFAAQLNGSAFHKLFSVSRDAYNIVRTSGLRMLAEIAGEWRLLTLPAVFEMGLSDCRWVYARRAAPSPSMPPRPPRIPRSNGKSPLKASLAGF